MKRILSMLVFTMFASYCLAQVEMGKTKNTIMKSKKVIALGTDKVMLDNFSINLILYGFAEDEGGGMGSTGTAKVGVRADLKEIDEALAQEIVNEAYSYFKGKWKERGVEVYSPSKEELENSKKYAKNAKKGKANIVNGGTTDNHTKKNHNMMAWPEGENIAFSGAGVVPANGNAAHLPPDYKGNHFSTNFSSTINFISFKTAKLGSTASVKAKPQLLANNVLTTTTWQKTKLGGYIGSNEAKGTEDFYTEKKTSEIGADLGAIGGSNSSLNSWNYLGDKAKYKNNALEMIKTGMDDLFADLDAVKAEAK